MHKTVVGVSIVLSFAAGCITSSLLVPPVRADNGPLRWEYMCVDGWAGVTHSSNQLGQDGWEMAAAAGTADHMMWCFKRKRP